MTDEELITMANSCELRLPNGEFERVVNLLRDVQQRVAREAAEECAKEERAAHVRSGMYARSEAARSEEAGARWCRKAIERKFGLDGKAGG